MLITSQIGVVTTGNHSNLGMDMQLYILEACGC